MSLQPGISPQQRVVNAVPGSQMYMNSPTGTQAPDFSNSGSVGSPGSDAGQFAGVVRATGTFRGSGGLPDKTSGHKAAEQ